MSCGCDSPGGGIAASLKATNTLPLLKNYYDKYNLRHLLLTMVTGKRWLVRTKDKRPRLHQLPEREADEDEFNFCCCSRW